MFKHNLFLSILYFFSCINILAQTSDCAYSGTPIPVGASCNPTNFNSTNNTDYWNSASGCNAADYDDAWWWFTATATSTTITYNSSDDAILHVFTGACATNMTAIACADNTSTGNETITISTVVGQNYAIRIQLYNSNNNMNGTICVYSTVPPSNNLCSNATSLPCGTTNLAGTTVNTTNVVHGTGCSMSNYGVWYTFVGDGQQTTISSTAASGFDHEMAIASGSCGSLTNIACVDAAFSGGTETYTFTTVNGVTYYIYIADWSSSSTTTGAFTISRTCTTAPSPPPNDLCSNATSLPCGTTNLAGTTVNTTNVVHGTGCSMSNYGVWYTFVGDGQQTTISSTAASGYDHEMAIASGSCASLTNITCEDVALSGGTETFTFTTINGVTYYIYIADWSSSSTTTGAFTISRTCTPAGGGGGAAIQDCVGAMTVCSDATVPGNASGQGIEEINSSNNGCLSSSSGENQSSWYVFSPVTSGNIALFIDVNTSTDYDWAIWGPYPPGSTTSTICPPNQQPIRCSFASGGTTFSETGSYDTGMGSASYSTPQFAPPTPSIYDGTGNTLNGWTPGLQVTAGQVYILLVDNWSADSNPFTLNFTLSGGATLGCTVLPIELLDFNVKNLGYENLIDWNTISEMNSDFFVIERLSNEENEFYEIGKMKAMGNSHIQVSYAFIDKNPIMVTIIIV